MRITISQDELKNIILDHLKKRGIEIGAESIEFEGFEQYGGWHELQDDVRVVATITEEGLNSNSPL